MDRFGCLCFFFLTVSLCTVFYLDNSPVVRHVAFRIWGGVSLGTFLLYFSISQGTKNVLI